MSKCALSKATWRLFLTNWQIADKLEEACHIEAVKHSFWKALDAHHTVRGATEALQYGIQPRPYKPLFPVRPA